MNARLLRALDSCVKGLNVTLRRSIAAAVIGLAVPVLSSCGSNFDAPTDEVYNPGVGVNDRSGTVDVLHALIVSGEKGSGTVVAAFVNNDEVEGDRLASISGAGDDASIGVNRAGSPVQIPAGGLYQLADEGNISTTGSQVQPGRFIELTFSFERAESVTMQVPVVANTGEFSDVPLPSGAASR